MGEGVRRELSLFSGVQAGSKGEQQREQTSEEAHPGVVLGGGGHLLLGAFLLLDLLVGHRAVWGDLGERAPTDDDTHQEGTPVVCAQFRAKSPGA